MLVPTQMKFSPKNNEKFTPVDHYNEGIVKFTFFSVLSLHRRCLF